MWGMSSDQVYNLLDDCIFAVFLLLLALIAGIVWIRINAHDCVCDYSKDPEADEEDGDVETHMPEASSPVVGVPVPTTEGSER
jgi:hypothetical protein